MMRILTEFRAYRLRHATAALQLSNYNLAKEIVDVKSANIREHKRVLLQRLDYLQNKVNNSRFDVFSHIALRFTKYKYDRLFIQQHKYIAIMQQLERIVIQQELDVQRTEQTASFSSLEKNLLASLNTDARQDLMHQDNRTSNLPSINHKVGFHQSIRQPALTDPLKNPHHPHQYFEPLSQEEIAKQKIASQEKLVALTIKQTQIGLSVDDKISLSEMVSANQRENTNVNIQQTNDQLWFKSLQANVGKACIVRDRLLKDRMRANALESRSQQISTAKPEDLSSVHDMIENRMKANNMRLKAMFEPLLLEKVWSAQRLELALTFVDQSLQIFYSSLSSDAKILTGDEMIFEKELIELLHTVLNHLSDLQEQQLK